MNVNSGGPHLLLFERDQQLTALLTSEFQLAGYECHAARTAVEVFDAIARYSIRLVLVNLAQPAAGRREFWVALDAQRRGRGVQVFTFRCMNLAGYGADDPDDRARTVRADMEVDGMLGVMNLVDAVRARIPGSTTGSISRIPATHVASRQPGTRETASASAPQVVVTPSSSITGQATSPLPMLASNGISTPSAPSPSSGPSAPTAAPPSAGPGNIPSSFTDKIRAVIYPSSRNFSQIPTGQETAGVQMNVQSLQNQASTNSSRDESGLEQLSRMIREQVPPKQEEEARQHQQAQPIGRQDSLSGGQVTQRPADSPPISATSLRASPIQDIAIERGDGGMASGGTNRQILSQEAEPSVGTMSRASGALINAFAPSVPDASPQTHPVAFVPPSTPALPPTPIPAPVSPPTAVSMPDSPAMSKPAPTPAPKSAPMPKPTLTPIEPENGKVEQDREESSSSFTEDRPGNRVATVGPPAQLTERVSILQPEESHIARTPVEQVQASVQGVIRHNETGRSASTDETLLNIVQSFPPMPSSEQQPQQAQQSQPLVLSGRATRSLGSVLLEGHLVPQHRLEVAQHIQRMLRGVDMNYQLGEILLMFKLLTPDQLLAASLVSYGLISTVQISALGRIRQELHSIGLEYDLESLLVLFRILSPEQLREVRASWSG